MAIIIVLTDYPVGIGEGFLYGVETSEAAQELQKLYNLSSFNEEVIINFPDQITLNKLKIKSIELRNLLSKHPGKKILATSNLTSKTHSLKELFCLSPESFNQNNL